LEKKRTNSIKEKGMKVLIADDDPVSLCLLKAKLTQWGYEAVLASDGNQAWQILQEGEAPRLAILDWMMPGMEGIEICQRVRRLKCAVPPYLILLTAKKEKEDVVAGLDAGADDYVTKPFDPSELEARMRVAERVITLERRLADRVKELEGALFHVKRLQGLLPICCYCKKIRNDQNYWQQVEIYISEHSEVQISHGICPDCYEKFVAPQFEQWKTE
jgi:CheY-like chemotaxis protein